MNAARKTQPTARALDGPIFALLCPHCDSKCRIRGGRALTRLAREVRVQCLNVECGHTFVGQFVITHTISQSACPRDGVDLRIAPPRRPIANDNPSAPSPPTGAPPDAAPDRGPEVPPRVDTS
ncbi:MAG: hypothetical protein CL808_02810 [Citromicrobium sp.]|nr:hypothetical protein [Citromicrobium sp.]